MEQYLAISPCCCLSILSNFFIMTTILLNKELQSTYEYQFIFVFAMFDMLQGSSTLIPCALYEDYVNMCRVQGVLIQFTSLSGILWTGFITLAMFYEIILERKRFSKGFYLPILVISLVSGFTAGLPLFFDVYKLSGGWCWFESPTFPYEQRDYMFRFLLFYAIAWIVIIWTVIVYLMIQYKSKNDFLYDFVGMRLVKRLKWYTWILAICYMPLTSVRIIQGAAPVPQWFMTTASAIIRLIGFFNAFAFLCSDKVKSIYFTSNQGIKKVQEKTNLSRSPVYLKLNQTLPK